ncbi:MAG: hypothetical protein DDT23_01199 [candidate division WS2 bacterium]|nr:hypothetical protein [Candidatus Lithacetigena glycinireducens]
MDVLLKIQSYFKNYPHTSYIPHLSLSLHHRFTAILYYFIYKKLKKFIADLSKFTIFSFSLIYITPKSLELFYRLRDFKAQESIMKKLRETFFNVFFKDIKHELPGMDINSNPFEFYNRDNFVILFDDWRSMINKLEDTLLISEDLPAVDVQIVEYIVSLEWYENNGCYQPKKVNPEKIETNRMTYNIIPKYNFSFPSISLARCLRCTMPTDMIIDGYCPLCKKLMEKSSGLDLESICQTEEGEEKLAYVFITIPSLIRHAKEVAAKRLILDMEQDRLKDNRPGLCPTEQGLFEFLQAVMDIEEFQNDLVKDKDKVRPIVQNPELMVYVMSEGVFWDFVPYIEEKVEKLRLDYALSGVLCHHTTPFWSIMEKLTTFAKREEIYRRGIYYDLSGGEVMIFTDNEVKRIRELSNSAPKSFEGKGQLNILVQLARKGSLEELILEIDIRKKQQKLNESFAENIKKAIRGLSSLTDERKNQNKRALFIKNVVKLA